MSKPIIRGIKKKWKVLIATIITIFLLYYLFMKIEVGDIYKSFNLLSLKLIISGFIFYLSSYVFRMIRLKLLLGKLIKYSSLFGVVCIHNFLSQLLPARIGEASYLVLIKTYGIDFEKNLASIAIARIFDIIVVASLFFTGLALIHEMLFDFFILFIIVAVVLFFILLVLYFLIFNQKVVLRLLEWMIKRTRRDFIVLLIFKLKDVITEFILLRSKRLLIELFISSFFIWFSLYLFMYLFLKAFFNELTMPETFLIVTIPVIFSILPIYGVAGFGTTETAFLFPLLWFGVNMDKAISIGFIIHLFQLLFFIFLGLVGVIFYIIDPHKVANE